MRNKKIRILHVAQAAGGVDRYIRMLLKYLDKEKFENILVCSQDFHEEDYRGLVDSFEQVEMIRAIGGNDLKAIKEVRTLIKKYNPDIVYAHSSKAGAIARIADIGLKNHCVYNPHGWAFNMRCSAKKKAIYTMIEKIAAPFCDKIICISDAEKQSALDKKICKEDMFFGLIAFVLLFGGETRYIIETGFSSLGRMIQNFVDLSTFTDPLRTSNFPQNWTIYYWAYWMVWCVAAPFFIGSISRGRTVRQTILGGYVFGVGSTLTSFIVLGNYSMGMQVTGKADFIAQYLESGDLYGMIVSIIKTMPGAPVIMVVVLLTMIAFYATSFDSIALTASCYSYHTLEDGEQPNKGIQLMWCILLILLPIALLFAESSMNNLQSVSIVAAFPIGAVIVMIAISFMKDAKKYMESLEAKEMDEISE